MCNITSVFLLTLDYQYQDQDANKVFAHANISVVDLAFSLFESTH
jgi:hypothetical protein